MQQKVLASYLSIGTRFQVGYDVVLVAQRDLLPDNQSGDAANHG